MHCGLTYTCLFTIHVDLLYVWSHNACWPTIHLGYDTCGPIVHVGLLNMWAHNTCGPTVHLELIYIRAQRRYGPSEHNTSSATSHMGPQFMWAHNICGPIVLLGL